MGVLYHARPTSRADNTRDGRAGHTKAAAERRGTPLTAPTARDTN